VFDYFTRPESLVRWMGDLAVLDPRPGGEFTVVFGAGSVRGRYLELDPPRRVVISWGRGGSAEFPPEASTLEVTLEPEGDGTRVSIVHSGLPEPEAPKHAAGWRGYLATLAAVASAAAVTPVEPRPPPAPGSGEGPPPGPARRT
jgi:uncharacterized protein YndB with AHSA1/START domain